MVDEAAHARAIASGAIGGAALDVFDVEPTTSSPLFDLDSVVVTTHLAASTTEAQEKAGDVIAEQVLLALASEFVPFAINVEAGEGVERRACTVFTRAKTTPTSNSTRKPTRNDRRTMASNATRYTLTDGDSTG